MRIARLPSYLAEKLPAQLPECTPTLPLPTSPCATQPGKIRAWMRHSKPLPASPCLSLPLSASLCLSFASLLPSLPPCPPCPCLGRGGLWCCSITLGAEHWGPKAHHLCKGVRWLVCGTVNQNKSLYPSQCDKQLMR